MTCLGSVAAIVTIKQSFTALLIYIEPGNPTDWYAESKSFSGVEEEIIVQAPY